MVADEQLIERMKDGDSLAFTELYDRYAARMLGLLVRMLPTRSDAEDVLQEVFWQAWKKADRYDSQRGNPLGWLLIMARSRAMDWLRRWKTTVSVTEAHEPCTSQQPIDDLERQESEATVQHFLLQLPDEQRKAIHLSFYDGLAHQDIARHLNIPLGTAKTRIRLGMKRLRELVAGNTPDRSPPAERVLR